MGDDDLFFRRWGFQGWRVVHHQRNAEVCQIDVIRRYSLGDFLVGRRQWRFSPILSLEVSCEDSLQVPDFEYPQSLLCRLKEYIAGHRLMDIVGMAYSVDTITIMVPLLEGED